METIETMTTPELKVELHMTPDLYRNLAREAGALDVARAFVIDGPEMAQAANDELKSIKARIVQVKKWREGFIEPAQKIMENARNLFNPAIQSLEAGEKYLKDALLTYTAEQERLAAEARRKAEEEARKARQEAEAKAAAERARAAELAAAAQREAEEAERRRQEAEAAGNARAAAAAAAEAAKAAAKATDIVANAEVKAQETVLMAAAAPVTPVVEATKLAGFSMRDNWGAELAPGKTEEAAVLEIARAIAAGRTDLAPMLKVDFSAANRLAKALKGSFNVPGLVAKNNPVASSRRA